MKPEIVSIAAPDGHRCHAILELPDGPGPFPGIVALHGGMGSQTAEALMAMATSDKMAPRHLVREGYAVLTSDYRHPSLVYLEIDDTVAAYQTLCAHPRVIPNRVGLCGTSHGAVCATYAGLRVAPACIVAEEAATDLAYRHRTLYRSIQEHQGPIDGYLKLDKELWDELVARLGGPPSRVPEAYEKASAHSQAAHMRSPILIVTGDDDYLPHCLEMYAALLKEGKDCELAFYRQAPHTFWWNRADIPAFAEADRTILAFLARYLKA